MTVSLTDEQNNALKSVRGWFHAYRTGRTKQQTYRLFGAAGVGKTFLAQHIIDDLDVVPTYASFTGKAALVMRKNGCHGASTIHSLIYKPNKNHETGITEFVLDKGSAVCDADLVVIDECSMVGPDLGRDLESFDKPILVLGDPNQLPPIRGAGYFTQQRPDFTLTEVHRQAKESPIVWFAHQILQGKRPGVGVYGQDRRLKVIERADLDGQMVLDADQVIVGLNKTRKQYNARIRNLLEIQTPYPVASEKVIGLRNVHSAGFLNGSMWEIDAIETPETLESKDDPEKPFLFDMSLKSLDGDGTLFGSVPLYYMMNREDKQLKLPRGCLEVDFGYAISGHKSQGSQWENVLVFDQSGAFRDDADKWIYTAVTRASETLTIVV